MSTYKLGDVSYDVTKLDEEAQSYFYLLKEAMIKIRSTNDEVQVLQAGANYIKDLFEDKLTDEAITEDTEDMDVTIEA
jgi:hypothetical protein|tara:strand:+ start:268 stop:501 length:234 start_codon:yes stop_codon:yes gene_type:complete